MPIIGPEKLGDAKTKIDLKVSAEQAKSFAAVAEDFKKAEETMTGGIKEELKEAKAQTIKLTQQVEEDKFARLEAKIEEKKPKEGGEVEVRYIYDTDVKQVRMAKEGERGGTLAQAKELKKMAEESEGVEKESPFMQNEEGQWVLNPKARVTGVEHMALQFMRQSQEKGEPIDPITAMTQAADKWKALREGLGVGSGEDSALKASLAAMQKTIEEMKEDRWQAQFDAQQKQLQTLADTLNKTLTAIGDMKKEKVGSTEMDVLRDIAEKGIDLARTELPGLRRDIKEAISSGAPPLGKTSEQREDRKKQFKQALDTDQEIEELGRRVFFTES